MAHFGGLMLLASMVDTALPPGKPATKATAALLVAAPFGIAHARGHNIFPRTEGPYRWVPSPFGAVGRTHLAISAVLFVPFLAASWYKFGGFWEKTTYKDNDGKEVVFWNTPPTDKKDAVLEPLSPNARIPLVLGSAALTALVWPGVIAGSIWEPENTPPTAKVDYSETSSETGYKKTVFKISGPNS